MLGCKALQCSLILCLLTSCGVQDASHYSAGGVVDLRGIGRSETPIALEGDWFVHANRFVGPGDPGYSNPDLILKNPRNLVGVQFGKEMRLGSTDRATLSLGLRLGPQEAGRHWAMLLPRAYSASRWVVHGRDEEGSIVSRKAVDLGEVSSNPLEVTASRDRGYLIIPFSGQVELSVELANKSFDKLGLERLPVLGDFDQLEALRLKYLIWNAAVIGLLIIIGLYHFAIFIMRPTESAPFWLALLALVSALWISLHSGVLELALEDSLNFESALRLQALCVPMLALSGLILLASLGATGIHANWRSAGMGLAACLMGMSLVAEPAAVSGFLGFVSRFFVGAVAVFWVYWSLLRPMLGEARERRLLRLGGVFWFLCWTIDLVDPPVHACQIELFFTGLIGWVTTVAFVLAIRNEDARVMMEGLSAELEVKNQELSELDKLKDEFLAKTSHELRTPLNGIIGLSESLLDGVGGPLEPRLRGNILMVEQSGKRLSHLVNDILDFSKLRNRRITLDRMPVNLFSAVELVVELSRPLIGDKKMDVYNVVSLSLPAVYADPNRLQQILFNLVGNAIKFTEKGYVTIRAEHNATTDQIDIAVEDSGVGIALQYRERIFRAFEQGDGSTQREHGGTGLGLAVSRELVVEHGSDLQVDSALGMGTTMSFSLPVSTGDVKWIGRPVTERDEAGKIKAGGALESEANRTRDNYPEKPEHSQCVAVVDDEAVNREVVAQQVSGEGYPVAVFEGGAQVLNWIAENGPPAVVLLDVMMPGLSGLDVLVQIRKQYSLQELPVLLLTARGTEGDMTEGFAAGANDYLIKPFSRPELMNRLRHHLGFTAMSSMLRNTNKVLEAELTKRHEMEGSLAQMRLRQEEAEKELGGLQSNIHDLTVRAARVKSKLLQAEKLASLGQMMAGIALSLSDPICSITEKLKDLRVLLGESVERIVPYLEREEADAKAFDDSLTILQSHMENMEIGADMVSKITRAMMNYDPSTHGDIQDTVMADLVGDCLTICGFRLRGFEMDVELDESCSARVHRTHLAQVVSNLLSNAVDALNERTGESLTAPRIRVSAKPALREGVDGLSIEVEDNGPGVPKELETQVFLPFFTTRPVGKGTGIGLAVSKRIVDDHKGYLWVDQSKRLGGARFCVWLPLGSGVRGAAE